MTLISLYWSVEVDMTLISLSIEQWQPAKWRSIEQWQPAKWRSIEQWQPAKWRSIEQWQPAKWRSIEQWQPAKWRSIEQWQPAKWRQRFPFSLCPRHVSPNFNVFRASLKHLLPCSFIHPFILLSIHPSTVSKLIIHLGAGCSFVGEHWLPVGLGRQINPSQ